MSNITFISATPKEADGRMLSSLEIIDNLSRNYGGKVRCVPLYGNKEGLPKVYNLSINQHNDADIVVLLHDDITVNDCLLFDKLEDARKRGLDIVGVAGSKGYQILNPSQPTGWWSPPNAKFGFAGSMVHHDAEHQTYITTSYGPAPQRVLVVDGCFIALMNKGLEAFRSGSLKFNEKFKFDFYDVALCMDAFKLGLNVGVEAILLTHDSVGKGALKPSFLEAQQVFIKEYFV